MPPLRLAPGVPRWEEVGCVQGRERHWLTVFSDLDPATRSKMAYLEHRSLLSSCSSPTLLVSSKNYPWPGLGLFLKIKMERTGLHQGQDWLFCDIFIELSELEVSRNLGGKHRQEPPLEISARPHDDQTLQHLSVPHSHKGGKKFNTPGNAFHFPLAIHTAWLAGQGCRQRLREEKPQAL